MTYKILEGKSASEAIKKELKSQVQNFIESYGFRPGLAFILVGDHSASKVYVKTKAKACQEVNIFSEELVLKAETSEEALLERIRIFNVRKDIHGILVQQPLPGHIRESVINEVILPEKDVDGFHPFNMGRLLLGDPQFIPCTPLGILELMEWHKVLVSGAHVVVLGRSNIVGKPLAALLVQKSLGANATVTICHTGTKKLPEHTRKAEVLIVAIGKPKFVKADMVSNGVVVVDVGINRLEDPSSEKGYRLVGDVDFDEVSKRASAITPVPGGVGMMTVAMLLKNTLKAAQISVQRSADRIQVENKT